MIQNWRRDYPVLVAEAHTLGSIGVIRSLGRAGYPVHACSPDPAALGFASRCAAAHAVSPDYLASDFADWLLQHVRDHDICAIVPSEGLLLAIRSRFREFAQLLPYAASESIVYSGISKADQIEIFSRGPSSERTARHIPPFILLRNGDRIPSESDLERLGFPLYLKVDGSYAVRGLGSNVHKVSTAVDAQRALRKLSSVYEKVLIEGHVPGVGTGAFFLIWEGVSRAEFMHMRLHEVPHTGGVSSYRKSWWHEGIYLDALAKLNAMKWQGVAMMEYRWNPADDEFYFIEMNGRFWGSLHLALYAGVDFPALLLDAFHGRLVQRTVGPSGKEVACRYTFPRDVMYVWSCFRDRSLARSAKLMALLEFFILSVRPSVHSDLWFPGDRGLYWRELWRFLSNIFQAISQKLSGASKLDTSG